MSVDSKVIIIRGKGRVMVCTRLVTQELTAPLTGLKPVLNWANVCSPEHTSDTSTNYDSFLN